MREEKINKRREGAVKRAQEKGVVELERFSIAGPHDSVREGFVVNPLSYEVC